MIALPNVDTLMAGGLSEWLDGQTAARAEAKAKIWRIVGLGIASALVIFAIGWTIGLIEVGYIFATGSFIIFAIWARTVWQKMIDTLKSEMNGALAKALAIDYSVDAFPGNEFKQACNFDLLPGYDNRHLQDQWHGSIEGTDFLLYDVRLTEERGSGKDRRTVEIYRGVILRMQFARAFLGTTLVRREGFKFTLFGDDKSFNGQKLERIKMVDPRFEDAFDIYGSDPVEARYLVHPAYCERLLALEKQFEGEKLKALFIAGDVVVTVETGDMFESASLNPALDRERLAKTIEQFGSIVQLVTLLNERPRN